jgi:phosphatidylinositol-binding clathrin assembly protein
MENEPENEITVTVFRLLVLDLLALFQALNQAMINILGRLPLPFGIMLLYPD